MSYPAFFSPFDQGEIWQKENGPKGEKKRKSAFNRKCAVLPIKT